MADKTVTVNLRASVAQYLASMGAASKVTGGFASGLTRVGGALTKFVTLPVLAAGAASIKAAVDWESAFAGVRKTVEATEPQFQALEEGLRGLARELPATHDEIAGVAEAAGQLGIALPNIKSFTRAMIDMSETTNLSADEAATAMARFANIMQMPESEFRRLGSTIVDLGNKGAATEAEIVQMALRIAGAGQQLGLTEADVASFAEALSSVGIRAEAGGSSISRAFIEINEHVNQAGEGLRLLADTAGISVPEFSRLFSEDAAQAMTLFIEGLGKVEEAGGDVFALLDQLGLSEVRTRDALLRLAGANDLLRTSLQTGAQAWEENTALSEEARKRYQTTAAQVQVLWNQIKDLGITIGEQLLPHVKTALEFIRDLVTGFSNLSSGTQEAIVKFGLLAATLGPLLLIVGKLVGGVGRLGAALAGGGVAGGAGAGAAGGATLLSRALGLLATPAGIATTGFGALVVALQKWDEGADTSQRNTQAWARALLAGEVSMGELKRELGDVPEVFGSVSDAFKMARSTAHSYFTSVVQDAARHGAAISEDTQKIIRGLIQAGKFTAAAEVLNKALGDLPPKVKTEILTPGLSGAITEVNHLVDSIAALPAKKTIQIIVQKEGAHLQAGGMNLPGGAYMVGEAGPEMVLLPRGSDVIPNHRLGAVEQVSMKTFGTMRAHPGGTTVVLNLNGDISLPNVEDGEEFVSELQGIARAGLSRRGLG